MPHASLVRMLDRVSSVGGIEESLEEWQQASVGVALLLELNCCPVSGSDSLYETMVPADLRAERLSDDDITYVVTKLADAFVEAEDAGSVARAHRGTLIWAIGRAPSWTAVGPLLSLSTMPSLSGMDWYQMLISLEEVAEISALHPQFDVVLQAFVDLDPRPMLKELDGSWLGNDLSSVADRLDQKISSLLCSTGPARSGRGATRADRG